VKIAFVTLNAYDILTGGTGGTAGGAQLQQSLIARELVDRGHEVAFVEHDSELKTQREVDGIRIHTKPKPTGNFLQRAVQATRGTLSTLKRIAPDVCYFRVLDFEMFPVATYCKLSGAKFVYGFSHDKEVTDEPNTLTGPIKGSRLYLYATRRTLSAADALIAQNEFQYERALGLFDTDVYHIPNGYVDPRVRTTDSDDVPVILWVSRFRSFKRPEVVLELADRIPEARFVIIGSENNQDLYDHVEMEAAKRENVEVLGYVPYEEIDAHFEECDVFLNTSESEGFPNTFLQAWAHRTPVASLAVDPDDILSQNEFGYCSNGSAGQLVDQLQQLVEDSELRKAMGDRAYEYFSDNHSIESITDQYESVFRSVIQET
jgi:glycosyltransferase involved in cell wall biosynthesis